MALVKFSIKQEKKQESNPQRSKTLKKLIKNKNYFLSVCCYGFIAAAQLGFRVLLALWIKTPQELGGIGWTTALTLGLIQGIGAFIIIGFCYVAVPWFSLKLGNLTSCAVLSILLCILVFLCPYTRDFDYVLLFVFLTIIYGLVMAFFTSYISLISIEISNCVSPSVVGAAHGLSQGVVALFSAGASATVGGIYGWTLAINSNFPFNCHFTFIVLCVILLLCTFTTLWPRKIKAELSNEFGYIIENQETPGEKNIPSL
jgi:sugar phosphate permease